MSARQPPEWAKHDWVWIGFPSHADLWVEDLEGARAEVIRFARAIWADGDGESVRLIAANPEAADAARYLAGPDIGVVEEPFGDIWLRDTGPIVVSDGSVRAALSFRFNGWGGKYELEGDDSIGLRLAASAGIPASRREWILEGGAIDVDGTGLAVTTEQCLLNPNRNPDLAKRDVEERLYRDLGIEQLLWLGEGLLNDHTDGHVDNLARFIAARTLAIPQADDTGDPNHGVYEDAANRAQSAGLKVVRLPSPGRTLRDGEIVPASYMNFYIGNSSIVVPIYGRPNDQAAVDAIGRLFPGRTVVGIEAHHTLTGGGSFHCISQQVPAL